ncbi:MAG: DNA ligase (NAD(+)), partial [uncultured Rubrobacteraceae bacterium]
VREITRQDQDRGAQGAGPVSQPPLLRRGCSGDPRRRVRRPLQRARIPGGRTPRARHPGLPHPESRRRAPGGVPAGPPRRPDALPGQRPQARRTERV